MGNVLYRKQGHMAYISLNSPETLNAVTREMASELREAWLDFKRDDDAWVAILSGEGKSFCAGVNVARYELGEWDYRKSYVIGDDRIGPWDYQVWKPVISACHRHVLGVGVWLVLQCDVRVASSDAMFGMPEPKVNIPTIFAPFLPDFVGRGIATELLLIGDSIDAKRAYELGLVNKVVPREQLIPECEKIASRLCENGPLAVRGMKEMLWRNYHILDYETVTNQIKGVAASVCNSEDAREARAAFKEKRKPKWKCR